MPDGEHIDSVLQHIDAQQREINGLLVENANLRGVRDQLRNELSLAEEGLANYHQEALSLHEQIVVLQEERDRLRNAHNEVLEELRLADSRHDLQAKIILALGLPDHREKAQR